MISVVISVVISVILVISVNRLTPPHGERRVALDTMLIIEDAAGVSFPIGTGKFKTRKINADKAK